ncbi:MAG: chromate transporter [Alphaproteobacteria bacterium]
MKIYWELFAAFFKVGLFTFGGGYAMLPLLQKEVVKKGWTTDEELMDYYAIGQVTPGIIAINVSTFVGFKVKGFWGACATMLGMVMPSFLIITTLALGLSKLWNNEIIVHAFKGIGLVIPALIFPVVLKMAKKGITDFITFFVFVSAFGLCFCKEISPLIIVLCAALFGFVFERKKK